VKIIRCAHILRELNEDYSAWTQAARDGGGPDLGLLSWMNANARIISMMALL
jgi:hypothetical protein